jgi:hypothetical protein
VRRIPILAMILAMAPAAVMAARTQDWSSGLTAKLEAKASKTVDVSLDQSMLKFACQFLDQKDQDQAKAKKICSNMQGIYVHSFEFDKEGDYSEQDLNEVRASLKAPVWSRIVNVKSKKDGENVEVYFKKEGEKFTGLVVIATQPTSLTFVNIMGPIDPEDLAKLGGQFGIPEMEVTHDGRDKDRSKDKAKEKDKDKTQDQMKDDDDDPKGDDL